jgi:hypothetical protein
LDICGLRFELLLAGKGKEPLCESGAPTRAFHGAIQEPVKSRILSQFFGKKIKVSDDRHKQVIEIVRYTTDKLAERLDLLCLQQRGLSSLATLYFIPELFVRPFEVGRSLGHQTLELHGGPALGLTERASLILSSSGSLCGNHSGLQRDGL